MYFYNLISFLSQFFQSFFQLHEQPTSSYHFANTVCFFTTYSSATTSSWISVCLFSTLQTMHPLEKSDQISSGKFFFTLTLPRVKPSYCYFHWHSYRRVFIMLSLVKIVYVCLSVSGLFIFEIGNMSFSFLYITYMLLPGTLLFINFLLIME